ncbi:MAG: ArsR family transcriptional regulator [Candidatus Aenigmarchaeota archaeon]|nr:ArsR family transcriptional regulator [Candidatus Aenigmarchaeota archaeon]
MAEVEDRIYSAFASIASSLGYSDIHGRIISALLVANKPMSLQELSRKTKYSDSAISLSLDLLELVGIIKKRKNMGDRKLYITLEGDLLEGLRRALTLKIQKEIITTLAEFETYKNDKKNDHIISVFEKEIKRLQEYVDRLAGVEIPKK